MSQQISSRAQLLVPASSDIVLDPMGLGGIWLPVSVVLHLCGGFLKSRSTTG
jgi:hypothetical protein